MTEHSYPIPGERLTLFALPEGEATDGEIALRIDMASPRDDWKLVDLESDYGYEALGKRPVIEFEGQYYLLIAVGQPRENHWQYDFRRLLNSDMLIPARVYPDEYLAEIEKQREDKRQNSGWYKARRRLLIPLAGTLPRRAREQLSAWTRLDFDGAATPAAIMLGFVTINWVILRFIIGAFLGANPWTNPLDLCMLALFVDTIIRASYIVMEHDEEYGILMLEYLETLILGPGPTDSSAKDQQFRS